MNTLVDRLRTYRYELIAFADGFIVLTMELVGSRIIAPYFGNSIFVWTAIIGVILGALSFGYWYGGKLADRGATHQGLAAIMIVAALALFLSLLGQSASLELARSVGDDIRIQAFVGSLLIFAPFNFCMGLLTPYLVKLRLTNLDTAGTSVGRLSAAGTAGSIAGTFATGYFLFAIVGSSALGLTMVVVLILVSFLAARRFIVWWRIVFLLIVLLVLSVPPFYLSSSRGLVASVDTAYARYDIVERVYRGQPARLLVTDGRSAQSGILTGDISQPAFGYIEQLAGIADIHGAPKRILLIGGGTYTLPDILAQRYPNVQIDVVEIDPGLDAIAERYFRFEPNSRISIIHEDGRAFLNQDQDRYDVIYVDAFSGTTPPFQLATKEAAERIEASLAPNGIVAINMISAITGKESGFAAAERATFASVFQAVEVGPVYSEYGLNDPQNLLLVASDNRRNILPDQLKPPLLDGGMILTDDFAPVEQLIPLR